MTARTEPSRRDLIKAAGAGVAGVAVAGVASVRAVVPQPAAVAPATPAATPVVDPRAANELTAYCGDLVGRKLGPYTVRSVGALERGGIPVVLASARGETFRVDVLRVDPFEGRTGIGRSGTVSVYLRNGGDGRTSTNEERGLGAMALAEELVQRERDGRRPPRDLLTMGEREALDAARAT